MNEEEIQDFIIYQENIIKGNRQLQHYLKRTVPHSYKKGFLYSSHQKMYNALGGQIGMAKAILKLLYQRTFEFAEDLNNVQEGHTKIKDVRIY